MNNHERESDSEIFAHTTERNKKEKEVLDTVNFGLYIRNTYIHRIMYIKTSCAYYIPCTR